MSDHNLRNRHLSTLILLALYLRGCLVTCYKAY